MNGIERISDTILAQAREKVEALLAQAQQEARDIAQRGEERATQECAAALLASEARVTDIAEKARLAAELSQRKALQNERQALIDETFERALKALLALPDDQYRALLVSLVQKAGSDGQGGELLFNARDRQLHGEAVLAEVCKTVSGTPLTLASEAASLVGGVVIRRGHIELNCTLDTLVRMLSEDSAYYVSNALFKEGA